MTPSRRRSAMMQVFAGAFLALSLAAHGVVVAQTPAQDTGSAPVLELSPAQRQTICQSISKIQKNNAAPTGFRVSVGAHMPAAIELKPLSDTLATLIPQAKDLEVAMIEKQVVLVDPKTKQVVAVVTQEEP